MGDYFIQTTTLGNLRDGVLRRRLGQCPWKDGILASMAEFLMHLHGLFFKLLALEVPGEADRLFHR